MVLKAESERLLFVQERMPKNKLLAPTDTSIYARLRLREELGIKLNDFGVNRREEGIGGSVLLSSSFGDLAVDVKGSPKVKFNATRSSFIDSTIEAEVPYNGAITILQGQRSVTVKHSI